MSARPIEVTDATFDQDVIERSFTMPVVVDFWAPWCGPCRALGPVLERLAGEADGAWVLAKVNVDQNRGVAERFRVQGIPAVHAFRDGKPVEQFVGALPEGEVRSWLKKLVPSAADRKLAEAARLEASDPQAAEALYLDTLALGGDAAAALLGLARITLAGGRVAEARRHIESAAMHVREPQFAELADLKLRLHAADAGDPAALAAAVDARPDDLEARYALGLALVGGQRYEEALGHLIEIVRRDRTFRDDGARKLMIDIFEKVGARSPVADAWREKLARVLYR
jgi:putative thioredoxin